MKKFLAGAVLAAGCGPASAGIAAHAADLKIALIYCKTGPLEAYAKQTEAGLMLGLEYLTGGTMMLDGRKIVVLAKDDQGKPDVAKSLLEQAYADDNVDLAIGTTSSGATHCHAAGRRGCQENPDRRARGRRTRSPATSGIATSSAAPATPPRTRSPPRSRSARAMSRSPLWRRTTPSATTASPPSRRRWRSPTAEARWCSRNTRRS